MSKLNKIATTINAEHGLSEMERQVNAVNKSSLTQEEKNKALKSRNKMIKTIVLTVIILTIIMGISIGIGFSINDEVGSIIGALSMIAMLVILIIFINIARKRKTFSDWTDAYEKVDKGFDGLNEEEINRLKPNDKEEKIIKKFKKKSAICTSIFLVSIALEFIILLNLGFSAYSPLTITIAFVITGIWYVKNDSYSVEIHRIQSGYYKKSFGYLCQKCKSEVRVNFEDIEKLDALPRNEQGIRVVNCHKCGHAVPFYDFDNALKDYKTYLEEIK